MFRILTEDVNRDGILAILDSELDGYTVSTGIGAWKGQRENSLAVDVLNVPGVYWKIQRIAERIKAINSQESVLILDLPVTATFI